MTYTQGDFPLQTRILDVKTYVILLFSIHNLHTPIWGAEIRLLGHP